MQQIRHVFAALAAAGLALAGAPVVADGDSDFKARLRSVNEVPSIISAASGRFEADLRGGSDRIRWELSYDGLEAAVTQAHIHIGQHHTNGGISVFLCANNPPITNAPPGTQTCPAPPARISGSIMASDVIGPAGQGVDPGEFAALLKALKAGAAYANVHTTKFPGGEIRGQIQGDD
jgi:hypothetical protein